MFGLGVKGSGRLVEDQQQRLLAHESPRQREFLPLAEADLDAFRPGGPQLRVEAGREPGDDVAGAGMLDRGPNRGQIVEARQIADVDGVPRPELESKEILKRAGDARAPAIGRHARQIDAVDQDAPAGGPIQPAQQLHQRRLAGAIFTCYRDHRSGREVNGHVGQREAIRAGIRERDAIEPNAVGQGVRHRQVGIGGERRRIVLEPRQPSRSVHPDAAQEPDLAHCAGHVGGQPRSRCEHEDDAAHRRCQHFRDEHDRGHIGGTEDQPGGCVPQRARDSRGSDRPVPPFPRSTPFRRETRADTGHPHFLARCRGRREVEEVSRQAVRGRAALFGGAFDGRTPRRDQDRWQREQRQRDQRGMDRGQHCDGHGEPENPPARGEQRPVHVVEHEHLVAQHAEAIEVFGPFLVLERRSRCLKPRHVRFERDGDAIAEAPLRAIADHPQKPGRGGRYAEPDRRRQHQPAPAAVHAVRQQLQPDGEQRVGERGEQRQAERDGHEPRLGLVAAFHRPPHRRQGRREIVSRGHRRLNPPRCRRIATPGARTWCDSVRPSPSARHGSRAR